MNAPATTVLARELASLVGEAGVREAARLHVAPATPQQVADVLKFANSKHLVVAPNGGGTKQAIGAQPAQVDVVLETRRLRSLLFYDPGDLTIGLGAGCTTGFAQDTVAANRQLLPLDSQLSTHATIGGALATAAHGPLKHGFGGVREFCIGVEFATTDGKVVKGGGRVVKNVAGYDLMKLMIGSLGTLGVITSANFKLFPAPHATRTFIAEFATIAEAMQFRDRIVRSPLMPMALDIASPNLFADTSWRLLLRAGGSENVLARYARDLSDGVTTTIEGNAEVGFWRSISDFPATMGERGGLVLDVVCPMQPVTAILEAAVRAAKENDLELSVAGRAIGALYLAFTAGNSVDQEAEAAGLQSHPSPKSGERLPPQQAQQTHLPGTPKVEHPSSEHAGETPALQASTLQQRFASVLAAVRKALPRDGTAVVVGRPISFDVDCWGASPTDLEAQRTIKRALDPENTLNRGRFLF
jgi:glycolate oxidase FAD binding subunit